MPRGIPNKPKEAQERTEDRDPHTLGIQRDEKEGRAPRVPMSAGGKLAVPESQKEEGYQYYWAINRPGELEKFKAAWWEHVTDERGNQVTTPAGKGDTHYLMRIKQEYYDEDIAKQQDRVNDAMVESAKVKKENDEYIPEGRESVLTRDVVGFD